MKQFNDLIADFWRDYAALVLLAGGLLGVVLLIGFAIWAKRSKKPLRPLALAFSMNLALLLNAEGMWVIALDQLKLPAIFAVLVFAVFEICFLTATSLAAEQYRRTSVYASDGTIVTPGHPGAMLWIAALIAGLSGVIVASNAVTFTEKLLRLAVPCMIFLMWWAALTAAGQRVRRGRFAYSPRRLAERWGWLIPDDDPDLVRMAAERQVRRMVVNYHRVSAGRFPKPWWRSRLLKDARTAGEPVVDEVIEQLSRIQRVMDLLVPGAVRINVPVRNPAAPVAAGTPVIAEPPASGPDPADVLSHALTPVASPPSNGQAVQFVEPVKFVPPSAAALIADEAAGRVDDSAAGAETGAAESFRDGLSSSGRPSAFPSGSGERYSGQPSPVASSSARPSPVPPSSGLPSPVPASSGLASSPLVSSGLAPSDLASSELVSPELASSGLPSSGLLSSGLTSSDLASSGLPSSGLAASGPASSGGETAVGGAVAGAVPGSHSAGRATVAQRAAAAGGVVLPVPAQRGAARDGTVVPGPAPAPAWASTPTGARPAVSIAGSPWWRLAVDRLSKMVAEEISAEDLPEMNYMRRTELARKLAPRVQELGEGVVRTFINEYISELDGEHVESAYPWRDFLPAPALAPDGSEAWHNALLDLRAALEEELGEGQPLDPEELADLLAPSAPRLDDATIRRFVGDYVLALSGMTAPGSVQPWAELLPRPRSARPASDDDLLEMHGAELFEHLRSTGRLSRYKVQAVTGIKSRVQADRIKSVIEERAAETATA
ncbi:MFS transporter [Actinoplanes sp. NPDC023801]|uniref:MFS transporter n=1 Tax=Actinoplanes sp. NPDC023801 TaxID=3154595 RepID=UPI0033CB0119